MIKRILVALSGTEYTTPAIEHALELAARHEAELTGVTLVDLHRLEDVGPVPLGGGAAAHELAEHRRELTTERVEQAVAEFEAACAKEHTPHRVVKETGDTMEALTGLARYHDVIVIGLRGLFGYGVLKDPDDLVIRLMAKGVRPILAVARDHYPVRRALIAYDGSMESAKAMKLFVQNRSWPDVQVEIACFDFAEDEAAELLNDAAAYCRAHGLDPMIAGVAESARHGLLPYATEWKADLVVMGASSRSKLLKLVLGDTAHHLIQDSTIPLYLSQ